MHGRSWSCLSVVLVVLVLRIIPTSMAAAQSDTVAAVQAKKQDALQSTLGVSSIKALLKGEPRATVDKLNSSMMAALLQTRQYDAVIELALIGTLADADDTRGVEKLQVFRINALVAQGKREEALRAAKGLFNVCELSFSKEALSLLVESLQTAYSSQPSIVGKFKLQVLANAQEDPDRRRNMLARYGGNSVMESISADPEPYVEVIARRKNSAGYRDLYGTGNLLLLSGRIKEAHDVFMKVYQVAPPGELKYASDGIAKLIKAEEGGLGKANQFVMSIRPKEGP